MIAKLKVASAIKKTTKSNKGYLNVKSDKGGYSNIWEENQYIWHLFTEGAELEVEYQTDGKFTTITGVVGVQKPSNDGGTTIATQGMPSAWDKLFPLLREMNDKLDWLVNERKTLEELPPLKDEIDVKKIPF